MKEKEFSLFFHGRYKTVDEEEKCFNFHYHYGLLIKEEEVKTFLDDLHPLFDKRFSFEEIQEDVVSLLRIAESVTLVGLKHGIQIFKSFDRRMVLEDELDNPNVSEFFDKSGLLGIFGLVNTHLKGHDLPTDIDRLYVSREDEGFILENKYDEIVDEVCYLNPDGPIFQLFSFLEGYANLTASCINKRRDGKSSEEEEEVIDTWQKRLWLIHFDKYWRLRRR